MLTRGPIYKNSKSRVLDTINYTLLYLFLSGKKLSHEARGSLVFTYFRFGHRILFFFSIKEKVLCNYQIIEIITNSFVHFHLFLLPLAWYTEKKNGQERRIMEGNQNLCLILCCVFGTLMINNSLEELDSNNLFDLNN